MRRAIGISGLAAGALMLGAAQAGFKLNFTDSAPHGIWMERTLAAVERGMWVSVCPPVLPITKTVAGMRLLSHGDCAGLDVVPLLKRVAAMPGDTVRIRKGEDAAVNGTALPNTTARPTLQAWPDGDYVVAPGEVWIFSSFSANSFDSRYFGPAKVDQVRGRAVPLAVSWEQS